MEKGALFPAELKQDLSFFVVSETHLSLDSHLDDPEGLSRGTREWVNLSCSIQFH
jgi:hypothetical protein